MHSFTSTVFFITIILLSVLICTSEAHTIAVAASAKECFFEELRKGDKMTVTFQVGDGGHLDIDFTVKKKKFFCIKK